MSSPGTEESTHKPTNQITNKLPGSAKAKNDRVPFMK
jgi:hypothetical protein